ncbi:hypothetical protein PHSY_006140 [Pseudozyma hubeiensis SY62]|uniref:Uncharacterized protein n=1 Tax=Pseudozyma hubeiensis (strain SY62) TaxID=1305764 RepID=R9PAZ4_PSEHS|nr:hypothetical protein PHSY_006140 [Pseudozyma hubeiensis SY62]GAC98546.1 hypothetical protein PHSY_006140 [Pseudozyma hubeiensis SY62]
MRGSRELIGPLSFSVRIDSRFEYCAVGSCDLKSETGINDGRVRERRCASLLKCGIFALLFGRFRLNRQGSRRRHRGINRDQLKATVRNKGDHQHHRPHVVRPLHEIG